MREKLRKAWAWMEPFDRFMLFPAIMSALVFFGSLFTSKVSWICGFALLCFIAGLTLRHYTPSQKK